ncbi:MAG TPA: hypothetical protein VGN37_16230 [Actinocatenispora sp.]
MAGAKDDGLQAALQEGWASACELYDHLARGGELTELPPGAVRLAPDEAPYADGVLGYARYYGTSVTYQQNSTFLLGSAAFVAAGMAANAAANAHARNRAQAMAAAQWRDQANVRTLLTDQRLLCDYGGRWLNFWHNGVVEFHGDLSRWLFILRYQVGSPIMLHGPAAPWFAVCIARLVYGERGLRLPVLAPLVQSIVEHRRPVIRGELSPNDPEPKALPPA